jgi:septum formation protein
MEKDSAPQAARFAAVGELRLAGLEPIVLASGSPRRREILHAVTWTFEAHAPNVDESLRIGEKAEDYVRRLALSKAEAVAAARLFGIVLAADTVVVVEDEILGKPVDEKDARRMLYKLNGRSHDVLTGLALKRAESGHSAVDLVRTHVRFAQMSAAEIDWYVSTGEPMDKAGAYAIQGRASLFIEKIDGEYWNVVGLPVRRVYEMIQELEAAKPA